MGSIIGDVAPFFALIAFGAAAGRLGVVDAGGRAGLNAFVFYAAMPALLFVSVIEGLGAAGSVNTRFASGYAVAGLIHFAAAWLLSRWAVSRGARRSAGAPAMAATLGNTSFLGLPLTLEVIGPAAAAPAALVLLIDNAVLMPITVAVLLAGRAAGATPMAAAGQAALGVARNPIVLGALAGLVCVMLSVGPPAPLMRTAELLGGAASPAALFALGTLMADKAKLLAASGRTVAGPVVLKLVAFPALAWIVLSALGVDGGTLAVGVVMAGAPTAVNVFVQVAAYGDDDVAAAAAVVATTALSFLTLSLLISWVV